MTTWLRAELFQMISLKKSGEWISKEQNYLKFRMKNDRNYCRYFIVDFPQMKLAFFWEYAVRTYRLRSIMFYSSRNFNYCGKMSIFWNCKISRSGESFFYGNWCVKLSENIRRRIWKSNVHTENSNKSQNASIFLHHSSIFNRGCLRPFKIYKYMFSSRYLVSYFF